MTAQGLCSVDTLIAQGITLLQEREFDRALVLLHDAELRVPDPDQVAPLLGLAYLGLGQEHLKEGDYEEAKLAFEEGSKYREDDARIWFGQAVANYHLAKYSEAETTLFNAIAIDQTQVAFFQLLSKVQYAEGKLREALGTLEQVYAMQSNEMNLAMLERVRKELRIEENMLRENQGFFQVSFADQGQSNLVEDILDVLDEAYREIGAELDYYPNYQIPVLLYTRQQFSQVTDSPDWAGAIYDGKIRIPVGGVSEMNSRLKALLFHEYAHVLFDILGKGRVPVWLNEGFAEVSGRRYFNPPLVHLQSAAELNTLLPIATLGQPFTKIAPERVPLAYEQSYSLTLFLVDDFGTYHVKELLELLGGAIPFEQAVNRVYGRYGMTWETIKTEWRNSLD